MVVAALLAVIVIGSVAEINAQSAGYRRATDTAYAQLASIVVDDSNQTGSQLASLMASAARLPDGPVAPNRSGGQPLPAGTSQTARARLQQGLDEAVTETAEEAVRASSLVPPDPSGSVSTQFIAVMTSACGQYLHAALDHRRLVGHGASARRRVSLGLIHTGGALCR